MSDLLSNHSLLIGGASAGLIFLIVSNILQGIAVFKLCDKSGFRGFKKFFFVTITVLIPLGLEAVLLIIAFDKGREKLEKRHAKQ